MREYLKTDYKYCDLYLNNLNITNSLHEFPKSN